MIKYLSLFSGIGGFEYGIQQSKYGNRAVCLYYSEIDKYADSIYRRRFPSETINGVTTHKPLGDVTLIDPRELADFDLLVAGFPCQSFSLAGKGRGFDDTRGTLFFEIARILSYKRPKYFLLENVRNLLSHNKGQTFTKILEVLSDLGYYVQWEILNSKDFVPQNRERIFIKGYLGERSGREIFSVGRDDEKISGRRLNPNKVKKLNNKAQAQLVYDIKGLSCSLSSNGGGQGGKTGLYKIPNDENTIQKTSIPVGTATKKGYDEAHPLDGVRLDHPNGSTGRGRVQQESVGALTCNAQWGTVTNEFRIRRLTPVECERLQGFPDDWTKYGVNGEIMSDTQRYKCCGNAVTTNVVTHIFNNWDLIV